MTDRYYFLFVLFGCLLCGCQQGDAKRPQDRKMQEQQQKLDMAIRKLEAEVDKVVRDGQQRYQGAVRSAQQFSDEFEKKARDITRSAEQLAQEAKKLQDLPEAFQQRSGAIVQAAQTAMSRLTGETEKPSPQGTPEDLPFGP